VVGEGGGEGFIRLGADAEVGVGLGEEDTAVFCEDIGCRDGEAPVRVAVDEGEIDEDGVIVGALVIGDGVDEAEFFGQRAAGVGEDGEGKSVLAGHEVALPLGLRADGDHEGFALAERAVEIAPGFEFGGAVGTPAAAEKLDDQGAEGEHVLTADQAAGGVVEGELGGEGADGEDFVLDARGEELGDGAFAHGEAFGLNQLAGVGGDLVELVLKASRHCSSEGNH